MRRLLGQSQRFLSPDELHIYAEVRAGSTVPGEGQMLAVWRKTWGIFFANVGDGRGYSRLTCFGSERMAVVQKRQRKSTYR